MANIDVTVTTSVSDESDFSVGTVDGLDMVDIDSFKHYQLHHVVFGTFPATSKWIFIPAISTLRYLIVHNTGANSVTMGYYNSTGLTLPSIPAGQIFIISDFVIANGFLLAALTEGNTADVIFIGD